MIPIPTPARRFASLLLLALATLGASSARAGELRLTTSNDLLSGGGAGDDLYTATVEVTLDSHLGRVTFGERMFTDRAHARRHDETYLELGRELPTSGGWQPEVRLGVLRLGRGLLGESIQNEVHRWVDSEAVHLDYREQTLWRPTVAASATRELGRAGGFWWSAAGDAFAAPDFRTWARLGVAAERSLGGGLAVRVGLGARADRVRTEWLAGHVRDQGLSGEVALRWQRLTLRWTQNVDGTGTEHLTLSWRLGDGAARTAGARH